MWLKDPTTGQDGYTLAAALLFGKERTLTSVVPFYKIDALCRRHNTDLYDARDLIHCNLLRAYDRLMAFGRQNLPEWPYIEGDQRKSLRDILMREVTMNLLIHAEYGSRHDSRLTIWKDRVEVVNWNIPYGYGLITLDNLRPHAKNPAIANFFAQLGIVEELGRGTRALYEYVPKISGGQMPLIEEKDEFKVMIPYLDEEPSEETKEKSKEKVLALITANNQITTQQLMAECQLSENAIYKIIRQLRESCIIEREGGRKEGRWKVLK